MILDRKGAGRAAGNTTAIATNGMSITNSNDGDNSNNRFTQLPPVSNNTASSTFDQRRFMGLFILTLTSVLVVHVLFGSPAWMGAISDGPSTKGERSSHSLSRNGDAPPPPSPEASSSTASTREIMTDDGIRLIIDVEEEDVDEGSSPDWFLSSSGYVCEVDPTVFTSNSNSAFVSEADASHFRTAVAYCSDPVENDDKRKRGKDSEQRIGEVRIHKRKLILIMSSPRSGSSFLDWIFRSIQHFTNQRDLDLVSVFELFTRSWIYKEQSPLARDVLLPMCVVEQDEKSSASANLLREEWKDLHTHMEEATTRDNFTESLLYLASKKESPAWFRRFVDLVQKEDDIAGRPVEILQYLRSIPAFSTNVSNSHLLIKFQQQNVKRLNTTFPVNNMTKTIESQENRLVIFFEMIRHVWKGRYEDIKVVVLWRRSFLDHYVSSRIANQLREFSTMDRKDDGNNSSESKIQVTIDRNHLYPSYKSWEQYNRLVHKVLSERPIEYTVLEYEDDLRNRTNQKETAKRLLDFLGVTMDQLQIIPSSSSENRNEDAVLDALIDFIPLKKQSQTPIEEEVSNWDEVVQWSETPLDKIRGDWERLFSS